MRSNFLGIGQRSSSGCTQTHDTDWKASPLGVLPALADRALMGHGRQPNHLPARSRGLSLDRMRVPQGHRVGAVQNAPRADPMLSAMIFLSPTALLSKLSVAIRQARCPSMVIHLAGEKLAR
jgi:hypothetical protein